MLNLSQHSITNTNTSRDHTKIVLDGHSALEPIHTQHALHIQAKDPKTSENYKEPRMKESQTTIKHKTPRTKRKEKEKLTLSTVKLSITIRQTCKERLEGIDKQYLGSQ